MPRIMRLISQFTQKEIRELFDKARLALKHPGLTILAAPKSHEIGRILVITSRKVGKAAKRNKIRRRLKALFYQEGMFKGEHDYAVIVKKDGIALSFDDLKALLKQAHEKASK